MPTHKIVGGKVNVYRRENSRFWQCATFLNGRNHRQSTKEESLAAAKEFAEDWYLGLRGKLKRGELKNEKTFAQAAAPAMRDFKASYGDARSPIYIKGHENRLRLHLVPFFGEMGLSEVNRARVQEYKILRKEEALEQRGKPLARSTIHQEIVCLRMVLDWAHDQGWLDRLPSLKERYRHSTKISHRAWFSPEEYKQLYEATRRRAKKPRRVRYAWESEQLHDFVLFMANTGLRPDEAYRLQYRDVRVIDDEATKERILLIEVRGKRGVGMCKSMPGAVVPFERLKERNQPEPSDLVFPKRHNVLFNRILKEENLKFDREGNPRTAYSLRHTYICLRLMEGADIYQVAKNCRTSVEMIEQYYASHLENMLDTAAINVRRR